MNSRMAPKLTLGSRVLLASAGLLPVAWPIAVDLRTLRAGLKARRDFAD